MIAVLFIVAFFIAMVIFFANRNAKNKQKIQKHIENGDIHPNIFDGDVAHPSADTRETFRKLANS